MTYKPILIVETAKKVDKLTAPALRLKLMNENHIIFCSGVSRRITYIKLLISLVRYELRIRKGEKKKHRVI